MYLIFDVETNGLPKKGAKDPRDVDLWPRVIQIAWQMYDNDFELHSQACHMIKPNGWTVPQEEFWIRHGYSTAQCHEKGVQDLFAFTEFMLAVQKCRFLIAHNLDFDHPVVAAECIRLGLSGKNRPQKFCSMKSTTQLVGAKAKNGRAKWPTLMELHQYCFLEEFTGAHDALDDVKALARCIKHLRDNTEFKFHLSI